METGLEEGGRFNSGNDGKSEVENNVWNGNMAQEIDYTGIHTGLLVQGPSVKYNRQDIEQTHIC